MRRLCIDRRPADPFGFCSRSHGCNSSLPQRFAVVFAEEPDGKQARASKGTGRYRYNTKRRQAQEQKDLQDLLVDPLYDPLFQDMDDDTSAAKDPFAASGGEGQKQRGRPRGSARLRHPSASKGARSAPAPAEPFEFRPLVSRDEEEQDPLVAFLTYKEPPPPKGPEIMKRYERWWYLRKQQEEAMHLHHKFRATEISNYAQSTALAAVMERLERQDEHSDDPDPLPSWIRAKKLISENWHMMEELSGSRKDTLEALNEYADITAERQHLLDTWDPSIYEGEPDSEEPVPAFIDRYLVPAAAAESAPRRSEQAESSIMDEILPDMDLFDSDDEG